MVALVWVFVVLSLSAYGAAIVRNVTAMLQGISGQTRSMAEISEPYR